MANVKPATEEDVELAKTVLPKIHQLMAKPGMTPGKVGAKWSIPAQAVNKALQWEATQKVEEERAKRQSSGDQPNSDVGTKTGTEKTKPSPRGESPPTPQREPRPQSTHVGVSSPYQQEGPYGVRFRGRNANAADPSGEEVGGDPEWTEELRRTSNERGRPTLPMIGGGQQTYGSPADDPMIGDYDIPDPMRELFRILTQRGILLPTARGIIHEYEREEEGDYDALFEIMTGMGIVPRVARFLVSRWKKFCEAGTSYKAGPTGDLSKLHRIQTDLGIRKAEEGESTDPRISEMDRRKVELEIKKTQLEIEKQERELGRSTTGSGSSEKHLIWIDRGYGPQEKWVTDEEEERYAPLRMAPEDFKKLHGGRSGDSDLEELKASIEEIHERMEQKEKDDRISRLETSIQMLISGGGGGNNKALDEIRKELAHTREQAVVAQRDQLKGDIARLEQRMSELGDPARKSAEIANEREKNINDVEKKALTEGVTAIANKVNKDGPVRTGMANLIDKASNSPAVERYIEGEIEDRINRKQNDPVNRDSTSEGPSSEEVEKELAEEQGPVNSGPTHEGAPKAKNIKLPESKATASIT